MRPAGRLLPYPGASHPSDEDSMKLRSVFVAAVAASSVALPGLAIAQDAPVADLNLTVSRALGQDARVRGTFRVDALEAADDGETRFDRGIQAVIDGRLVMQTGGGDIPLTLTREATLERPQPGHFSVLNRGGARASDTFLEQVAATGRIVLTARDEDGAELFEPRTLSVRVVGPDEDIVRTPFTAESVLADGSTSQLTGDVLVVRNANGRGRVVVRYAAAGDPPVREIFFEAVEANMYFRAPEPGSGPSDETVEVIRVAPEPVRVRFEAGAGDASDVLAAVYGNPQYAGGVSIAVGDVNGDDAMLQTVASGTATVHDRSQRVVLREDRRDPTLARAVIRVSDPSQIPADVVVSVSDPYSEDGFTGTSAPVDSALFGVVIGLNTTKENPDVPLEALLSPGTGGAPATCGFTRDEARAMLPEDQCALDPATASCTTPSGAEIRLRESRGGASLFTSVQYPYFLEAPRVGTVMVLDGNGRPVVRGAAESTVYRATVEVPGIPVVESDDLERRVLIEFYNEDGQATGSTGASFLPAGGLFPLIPEPLGPIRFDPGCAWWDLLCEWGF